MYVGLRAMRLASYLFLFVLLISTVDAAAAEQVSRGATPDWPPAPAAASPGWDAPRFEKYPAKPTPEGPGAMPRFNGPNWTPETKAKIREAVKSGYNFAGHYTIAEVACGTECKSAWVVDGRSGAIHAFPLGGEGTSSLKLVYNVKSRLIKAAWLNSEKVLCTQQDFNWDGKDFNNIVGMDHTDKGTFFRCDVLDSSVSMEWPSDEAKISPGDELSFETFPARVFQNGPVKLPQFDGRDRGAREYRTRISDAMKSGANFAGHYTIIEIGCGTGYLCVYFADTNSGKVWDFPLGGMEYSNLELKYSLDSRLIKARWIDGLNGDQADCAESVAEWDGRNFSSFGKTHRGVADETYCSFDPPQNE
ncbi:MULTISPECIES: hypothetical protein [unclassified Mesorhizobium]|uniref:hypothetical protein n=1 Tax=unclassified Mesorhizobium TaxID=325217 RepID=UPI000FD77DF5|nr:MULTISPECIES: hypothetical protein [unclassified Mesorhizobium]TGQ17280.1 hypothetical protein EN862_007375 [Mesorhizobium sp. M2E.F.Ca.ET.219.01.1.1]TGT76563.1 hypothetical protein EN809_002830 [Mesorhizobium sp. M2E.F.Ca.ET.166.01.1.1]TGW02676.1 hypothetical protein EN797_002830 [Mesorhizobium sp. M2E.F.Ca.ET.154.01.1.1]